MKLMLRFLATVFLFWVQATSPAEESPWKGMITISGREAQAVVVAIREFEKHQGTKTEKGEPVYGDLRHYDIELLRKGDVLKVGFSPELGPIDRKEGVVGSGTQYGIATTYHISLITLKIERQTFSR